MFLILLLEKFVVQPGVSLDYICKSKIWINPKNILLKRFYENHCLQMLVFFSLSFRLIFYCLILFIDSEMPKRGNPTRMLT